ncbi:hypothetical protein H6H01_04155 [Nostoc calcicola FACHB-3891]|nr:hypothetical protein [Nostoc calcicola FACHB-3891]
MIINLSRLAATTISTLAIGMVGTILFSTFWNSNTPPQKLFSSSNSITATAAAVEIAHNSKANRPLTKAATISVEGEKSSINLQLYDKYDDLFTTYFSNEDFVAEGFSSGEGTGVRFISNVDGNKNENAYIAISFPNSFKTLEQLRSFVNGTSGLMGSNGWKVLSNTEDLSYGWTKQKIVFNEGEDMGGIVYLGQQNGKIFYVIIHCPSDYQEGFFPRADLVLRDLQVGD